MAFRLPSFRRIWDEVRDVFDANTAADQRRRVAAGQPRMYQDQVRRAPTPVQQVIRQAPGVIRNIAQPQRVIQKPVIDVARFLGTNAPKAVVKVAPLMNPGTATIKLAGMGIKAVTPSINNYFKPIAGAPVRSRDVVREAVGGIGRDAEEMARYTAEAPVRVVAQIQGREIKKSELPNYGRLLPKRTDDGKPYTVAKPYTQGGIETAEREWGLEGSTAKIVGGGAGLLLGALDAVPGGRVGKGGLRSLAGAIDVGTVENILKGLKGAEVVSGDRRAIRQIAQTQDTQKIDAIIRESVSKYSPQQEKVVRGGFNTKTTGIPSVDHVLNAKNSDQTVDHFGKKLSLAEYLRVAKGQEGNIVNMSPDEYLERAYRLSDSSDSYESWLGAHGGKIDNYVEMMRGGTKFDMPVIGKNMQEGRTRAMAAKRLGLKEIPVVDLDPRPSLVRVAPTTKSKEMAQAESLGLSPEQINELKMRPTAELTANQSAKAANKGAQIDAGQDMAPNRRAQTQAAIDRKNAGEPVRILGGGNQEPKVQIVGKVTKDPRVANILDQLGRSRSASAAEESLVSARLSKVAREEGVDLSDPDFIYRYQTGQLNPGGEDRVAAAIRQITDPVFERQKKVNPLVEYRKNYLPQSYKNPEEQVQDASRRLMQQTGSTSPRVFNTYQEAAEFGLDPKYSSVDQMIARNAVEARQALENRQIVQKGLDDGIFDISPRGGWAPVEGMFAPNGGQVYAQKQVADVLNGALQENVSDIGRVLRGAATVSRTAQDVALQGGIPGTPLNFFVAGQGIRDTTRNIGTLATGRPIKAIQQQTHLVASFLRSFSVRATQERFIQNADFVQEMAARGLPLSVQTGLSADAGVLARNWNKLGNNPTFGRYLPNRMLDTSLEVYQQTRGKIGDQAALDLAADTTKRFSGIVDQLARGRSNMKQDLMTATLFAPKYREGIINALNNAVRSVIDPRTWGQREFRASRELILGMGITLAAYDHLNKQLNGHGMLGNRQYQELSLQIPYGEKDEKGNQKVANIPFMPGFMTIPRAIFGAAKSAAGGDTKGIVAEASKMLSMPINTAGAVLGNRDYFGNPIFVDDETAEKEGVEADSAAERLSKIGAYVIGQNSPSWIRAGIDKFGPRQKSTEQAVATALEAPIRFGKVYNPETTTFFKLNDEAQAQLNPNDKAAWGVAFPKSKNALGDDIRDTSPGDRILKATTLRESPEVFRVRAEMERKMRDKTGKKIDPIYDLPWDQAKDALWARSFAPGESGDTKKEILYNQKWYPKFRQQETAYYQDLEKKLGKRKDPYGYPSDTPEIAKLEEQYYKLPTGDGARGGNKSRRLFLERNKALTDHWAKNKEAQNRHRMALGLPPIEIEDFSGGSAVASSGGGGGSSRRGSRGGRQGRRGGGGGGGATVNINPYKYYDAPAKMKLSTKKITVKGTKVAVKPRSKSGNKAKIVSRKLRA